MKKLLLLLLVLLMVSCQQETLNKIVVAEQYGLAYAPIQIMKEKGFLDDELLEYEIEWVRLANTTAIREAMVANQLDVGFLGIPPFLIGYDNKAEWKIFSGLSRAPLALMSDGLKSLDEITPDMKIALPQPGSIQHILLSMAAEKKYGEADYFDKQLITMKHPDGMGAVLSQAVAAHFTSPPYLFEEAKRGLTPVVKGEACMGEAFTFIVGVTTVKFHENTEAFDALNRALLKSINFMYSNQEETLNILSLSYDYDLETLKSYIYDSDIVYENQILGIPKFIKFMYAQGYLQNTYDESDVKW